jgi:hypothetical protein
MKLGQLCHLESRFVRMPYDDKRIAPSIFLQAHPEYRGGLAAIKMVMAFRAWAHARAAAEVYIGVASAFPFTAPGAFCPSWA